MKRSREAVVRDFMLLVVVLAGRDADGLRVGRPTEYVFIYNNLARCGGGVVSFGSETSGGSPPAACRRK